MATIPGVNDKRTKNPLLDAIQTPAAPLPVSSINNPTPSAAKPTQVSGEAPAPPPMVDYLPPPLPDTVAGRLAANNVVPGQAGSADEELRAIYRGQADINRLKQNQRIQAENALRAQEYEQQLAAFQLAERKRILAPITNMAGISTPVSPSEMIGGAGSEAAAGIALGAGAGAAGAAIGAGAGALFGGVGAAPGAVIGAALGTGGGVLTKIAGAKRGNVKEAKVMFNQAVGNMNDLIAMANSGQYDPAWLTMLWNEQQGHIDEAERVLKEATSTPVNKFLSDGGDELTKVQGYRDMQWVFNQKFVNALRNPNPNSPMAASFNNLNENVAQ